MEPEYSKILQDRSKYNRPPAINGEDFGFKNLLFSKYSQEKRQVEWALTTNSLEFLSLVFPFEEYFDSLSVSIFINLTVYLKNSFLQNNGKSMLLFEIVSSNLMSNFLWN